MAKGLWITTSAVALLGCAASQALAQEAPASDQASQLEEVVVTAERRTTNLQTTAVAAAVLSGEQLQDRGVSNIETLQFSMPSVTVQNSGQGNSFNIRGIGTSALSTGVEPASRSCGDLRAPSRARTPRGARSSSPSATRI